MRKLADALVAIPNRGICTIRRSIGKGLLMRFLSLVLAGLLAAAWPAVAQQTLPDAPSVRDWHGVELLAPGRAVTVDGKGSHSTCVVQRSDADSLACKGGTSFARGDISSVRMHHRWRSAGVAAVIGFGVGAVIGAAAGDPGCKPNTFCLNVVSKGELALGLGTAVAVVALPVGYFTDFTRSTVYKSR